MQSTAKGKRGRQQVHWVLSLLPFLPTPKGPVENFQNSKALGSNLKDTAMGSRLPSICKMSESSTPNTAKITNLITTMTVEQLCLIFILHYSIDTSYSTH